MGANIWFWLIYVITLIFGVWGMNPWRPANQPWAPFGGWLILFILIGILGLHAFGSPIRCGLLLNFHPVAVRVSADVTPIGAV